MKKRFTEEQITRALRQAEAGTAVREICRDLGIAEPTFYRWKKRYGSLGVPEIRELRSLRDENAKLKRLLAEDRISHQAIEPLNLNIDIEINIARDTEFEQLVPNCRIGLTSIACRRVNNTQLTDIQALRFDPDFDGGPGRPHVPAKVAVQITVAELSAEVADRQIVIELEEELRGQLIRTRFGKWIAGQCLQLIQLPAFQRKPILALAPVGGVSNAALYPQ